MDITKGFLKVCPECGGDDWENRESDLKCRKCDLVVDYDEVTKKPLAAIQGALTEGSEKSNKEYQSYSDDLRNRIEDKEAEGWKILESEPDRVIMGKSKKASLVGHLVIFIFIGWWTLGFGNLAYHELKKHVYEKTVLREKQSTLREKPTTENEPADKLRSLEELREEGLLSEQEYESKRQDIIRNL